MNRPESNVERLRRELAEAEAAERRQAADPDANPAHSPHVMGARGEAPTDPMTPAPPPGEGPVSRTEVEPAPGSSQYWGSEHVEDQEPAQEEPSLAERLHDDYRAGRLNPRMALEGLLALAAGRDELVYADEREDDPA
jgi:hypothetical protein